MAEFRRLISYIYEYEGNVKGKNVGFVKLEARNGMCRLNVNVKKLYMGSGDMGVYLLTGRQEIFLGNIFLRNGCGEFRAVVQVADVQDSGETMDECYGLTIHGRDETWRVYTTIWEDAVAQTAQLMLEPVTSENAFEHEVESRRLSSVVPEMPKADRRQEKQDNAQERRMEPDSENKTASHRQSEEIQKTGAVLENTAAEGLSAGSLQDQSRPVLPDFEMGLLEIETEQPDVPLKRNRRTESIDAIRNIGNFSESERNAAERTVTAPEINAAEEEVTERKVSEQKAPERKASELEIPEPKIPELNASEPRRRKPQEEQQPVIYQYREEPLIIGDPEALAKLDAEDAEENKVPIWDFLSKTYPKIQAFDSEHGCQVLVIKPQDIGLLPREIWIYGNNSFLLHGYYNYRYLILARLENPRGTPRYLLGVPGHYYSNEKYMASMFGFPHFVLSKKQTTQNGRFGYWYTDIRLENGTPDQNRAAANASAETAASAAKTAAQSKKRLL